MSIFPFFFSNTMPILFGVLVHPVKKTTFLSAPCSWVWLYVYVLVHEMQMKVPHGPSGKVL